VEQLCNTASKTDENSKTNAMHEMYEKKEKIQATINK